MLDTPSIINRLFPSDRRRWQYLPLDSIAKQEFQDVEPNPLLDPEKCENWLHKLHKKFFVDSSYGGYGEDRSNLWRGHYMLPHHPIHLGVDFNILSPCPVESPINGQVVHCSQDHDQNGGWGGKVVVQIARDEFLLFAHLGLLTSSFGPIYQGDRIGFIGESEVNGNWFPHLHLQRIIGDWNNIDGYGTTEDLRRCPDPLLL